MVKLILQTGSELAQYADTRFMECHIWLQLIIINDNDDMMFISEWGPVCRDTM